MAKKAAGERRLFVLDTNVLMHDPTALFRFKEHDVILPMVVLEELDKGKKGVSEVARNVRQCSRFIDELISGASLADIKRGLELGAAYPVDSRLKPSGRLYFQIDSISARLPDALPGSSADNSILSTALALQVERPDVQVVLVSKDINLRIKAAVVGIRAEDFSSDQVLDDVDLLYSGVSRLPPNFWDTHSKDMHSWQEDGHTFYRLQGPMVENWHPNECLWMQGEQGFSAIVRGVEQGVALIEVVTEFTQPRQSIWGVHALNPEQNFALNLLMDPQIDFVTLVGMAGSGKTLLALAAGLSQTLDSKLYKEIVMTRVTVPVGEDIGFLPGTEEEKMAPWMGALMDNLEVLTQSEEGGEWGRAATNDLLRNRIKIRSLNFMRGRTFLNRYIILDEAQNLTAKQLKTLITRAGPGTKIVCTGNLAQIDTPYLSATTSGLTYVVDHFKNWGHSGHITLMRGERSRLADFASTML